MHDIGKIGIPDNILRKPGKLTPEEWVTMKKHCRIGAGIIGYHHSELLNLARIIALTHHEKWDGTGYPLGLSKETIPFETRIVTIADVFDALTTKRPYKEAWPLKRAVEYLQNGAGKQFDPELVKLFIKNMPDVVNIMHQWAEHDGTKTEILIQDIAPEKPGDMIWDKKYSVKVPILDEHHKEILSLLNRLYCLSKTNCRDFSMEDFFGALFEYTFKHFQEEERQMELYDYPDLESHKLQHLKLKLETEHQYQIYHGDITKIPPELFIMLTNWWINHIQNVDMKYVEYLKVDKREAILV